MSFPAGNLTRETAGTGRNQRTFAYNQEVSDYHLNYSNGVQYLSSKRPLPVRRSPQTLGEPVSNVVSFCDNLPDEESTCHDRERPLWRFLRSGLALLAGVRCQLLFAGNQ